MLKLNSPEEQVVRLVASTVEDTAKVKGYQTYPKYHEVKMVLEALMIVNKALKRVEEKDGKRNKRKTTG